MVYRCNNKIFEGGQGWKTYENMFKNYIDIDPLIAPKIKQHIKWAIQNLKKTDRIVWFLRFIRIIIAGEIDQRQQAINAAPSLKTPIKFDASEVSISVSNKLKDKPITYKQKEIIGLNKRLGQNFYDIPDTPQKIRTLQDKLSHFLSLPIPSIQTIIWNSQSPNELLAEFKESEKEWQESSSERNQITYRKGNEPTKIIDFHDGYAWFDLEKGYCDKEAAAMGHCGNGQYKNGTILSLRKLVSDGDKTSWYPVLTFISDNGVLGEMKGRNNNKPVEKYHPYIIALLKSDYVTEIQGGGYMPEHNFKLSDLTSEEQTELLKLKPDLGDVYDMWKKDGLTKRVLNRLISTLDSRGFPTNNIRYDKENNCFIVNEWEDFDAFIRHGVCDDTCEKISDIALGKEDWQISQDVDVKKSFVEVVANLPDDWQKKIIEKSGLLHSSWSSIEELAIKAAYKLANSDDEYFKVFEQILKSGEHVKEQAWERLADYVDTGWAYKSWHVYDNIPSDVNELKKFIQNDDNVYLYLSTDDIMSYAISETDDYDSGYNSENLRDTNGGSIDWENIDSDTLSERRRDNGLEIESFRTKGPRSIFLIGVKEDELDLEEEFINALRSGNYSAKINDPRQSEMTFQESLRRILEMAGLKPEGKIKNLW